MAKISKKKIKTFRCPDPVHKGREVPASEFGKGGNNGRQGYCKSCRARKAREKYQTLKAEKKKIRRAKQVKRARNRPSQLKKAMKPIIVPSKTLTEVKVENLECKTCHIDKPKINTYFQSNGRGGYRQPCKECLKSKTKISEKD